MFSHSTVMDLVEQCGQVCIRQDGLDYAAVKNNSTVSVAQNNQGLFFNLAGPLGAIWSPYSMTSHLGPG